MKKRGQGSLFEDEPWAQDENEFDFDDEDELDDEWEDDEDDGEESDEGELDGGEFSERQIEAHLDEFDAKLDALDEAEKEAKSDDRAQFEYIKHKLLAHLESMM